MSWTISVSHKMGVPLWQVELALVLCSLIVFYLVGFSVGSDSKESACIARDPDSIPGSG